MPYDIGVYNNFTSYTLMFTDQPTFIYVRVSSKGQENEGGSIFEQIELTTSYIKSKKMKLVKIFQETCSAKQKGRVIYDQMLNQVKRYRGKVNIVCFFLDRMFRNPQDYAELDQIMRDNPDFNLHVISMGKVFSWRSSPEDKKQLWDCVGNATKYSQDLSIKVRVGILRCLKRGHPPNKVPVGYKKSKDEEKKSIVVVDESKKFFVKRCFELYATGDYSLEDLCEHIVRNHLTEKKYFYRSTLHKMLTNPFYIGKFYFKGDYYDGKYPPIISKELFNRVQKLMHAEATGTPVKQDFLYARLIKCFYCGCMIVFEMKKGKYEYAHCTNRNLNKPCKIKYIRREALDRQIESIFDNICIPEKNFEVFKSELYEMHKQKTYFTEYSIKNFDEQLLKLENKKEILLDKCLDGLISDELYSKKIKQIEDEILKIRVEKSKIKKAPNKFSEYVENLLELCKNAPRLYRDASPEKKRKLLKLVCSNLLLKDDELVVTLAPPFVQLSEIQKNRQNFHSVHFTGR